MSSSVVVSLACQLKSQQNVTTCQPEIADWIIVIIMFVQKLKLKLFKQNQSNSS